MNKDDENKLLHRMHEAQNEYTRYCFQAETPRKNSSQYRLFLHGPVWGFYQTKDPQMMQLIRAFNDSKALKAEILKSINMELKHLVDREPDDINTGKICMNRVQKQELDSLSFDDWIRKHASWAQMDWGGITVPDDDLLGFLYLFYKYQNYCNYIDSPYNSRLDKIESLYEGRLNKGSQFYKYGLIPVDADRELMVKKPPRIYDSSIDKTLFVKNVPSELLDKLEELNRDGLIGSLSIRVDNNYINGCATRESIQEEIERGKAFSLTDIGQTWITKLYSKQYGDQLWVVSNGTDITFEELCDDFETYDDSIVTQVLHLQVSSTPSEKCITHIDHEYVFYSMEDYEKRKNNATQKGSSQHRLKSFKVDNARIPFSLTYRVSWLDTTGEQLPEVSISFLCFVLDCYFKHTDLLKEYFSVT